ncbi:MAG: NUDIX hydrolase, partial [Candidatus Aminicenantes bacterium]|nr:NUDIX hydrolase [Candidatus Aminicenantes bacterium]
MKTRKKFRNPVPTVDIIIEIDGGRKDPEIVLIERRNPPPGWALPGGFVDYGETLESAARREAREETSLNVERLRQFHVYSEPDRDPRLHTVSTVFIARARGTPQGADDARRARAFDPLRIDVPLAFDHRRILDDYIASRKGHDPWTTRTKRKTG